MSDIINEMKSTTCFPYILELFNCYLLERNQQEYEFGPYAYLFLTVGGPITSDPSCVIYSVFLKLAIRSGGGGGRGITTIY